MMNNREEIPDWQLERYLLGELPPGLEDEIKRRLAEDNSARARLAALEKSNEEILSSYPSAMMSAKIEKRYREKYGKGEQQTSETRRRKVRGFALALSAAVIALAVLVPLRNMIRQGQSDGGTPEIRMKGAKPHLVVYRKAGDKITRLKNGEKAKERDVLQLSYVAVGEKYGVIYSIDGRGVVTVHYPAAGSGKAPKLDQNGEIYLEYAYELDDAPLFERFFFVTSDKPFDTAVVEKAVRQLASKTGHVRKKDLKLPSGFRQYSIILNK
jgi:hypothetical protein